MEVYERILRKVRGAMWAHHRRLMPERQFQRILGYVYSHKYEYQIRLDSMTCVGTELGGKVEVTTTPSGYVKRVRINPDVEDYSFAQKRTLLLGAYAAACRQGQTIMADAELRIYEQFLRDLKPVVLGIRDNPEFYTVDGVETPLGMLQNRTVPSRTIPHASAYRPQEEWNYRQKELKKWMESSEGLKWIRTARGKEFLRGLPEYLPRGAPGRKKSTGPLDLPVPYMSMDEKALLHRNWEAFLDNKGVAEMMWNQSMVADKMSQDEAARRAGKAWHYPLNKAAITRY